MQISSRFTIATHMLVIIALKGKESKVTSDFLASSVGVNPVIIRKHELLSSPVPFPQAYPLFPFRIDWSHWHFAERCPPD